MLEYALHNYKCGTQGGGVQYFNHNITKDSYIIEKNEGKKAREKETETETETEKERRKREQKGKGEMYK